MDILYPIGPHSKTDNLELKCSLRSIDEYGIDIDNVYVVGYPPEWLNKNVTKIYKPDEFKPINAKLKNKLIAQNILYALDNSDIGENFCLSMDDHFYTKPTKFKNYPIYVKSIWYAPDGKLPSDKIGQDYADFLVDVKQTLESLGLSTYYFTIHKNMRFTRKDVDACRHLFKYCFDNDLPIEFSILVYNYKYTQNNFKFKIIKDSKIYRGLDWWKTEMNESFSLDDFKVGSSLYILLSNRYPNKSKYEK